MIDIGLIKDNNWFRYRTGAIIVRDNKLLAVKSAFGTNHYYMIGGGVHMGETSENCIKREVLEETGMALDIERLAVISENFFRGIGGKIDGMDCQTIEFYFVMNVRDEEMSKCKKITDDGEELVWISIDEIKDINIKPIFVKERITEIINSNNIIHVVEERDR